MTIVGVALAGGIFFLYTKPEYDSVKTTQIKIAQYDAALYKAAELQKLKQTLLSRFSAFNPRDLDRLHKFLPDHVDNVRLILDLDNLASNYGLSLQNVDVSSSVTRSANSQSTIGEIGTPDQKYDSLTFTFSTRATYANFVQFMTGIESSLRIVDLVSLTIDPDLAGSATVLPGAPSRNPSEPQYSYRITLRTYWLK